MNSKILEGRLKELAYRIVAMTDNLPKNKLSNIIEGQLLRSTFSAAANYRAACKGISTKSFISKLSISFEEADETLFWLEVILELKLISEKKLSLLIKEAYELSSILASSRKTLQKKQNDPQNKSNLKS
ncbi:MAG: four helix bundle protein [Oligoflexus sp.]|nr:four helix bundle protein [Pseudopedobacter sp.]